VNTYWDLTEQERAALNRDQIDGYVGMELMHKGVVAPKPPDLEPVHEVKDVPTCRFYSVRHGYRTHELFHTLEQAEAFIALNPFELETDYGTDAKIAKPMGELAIEPMDLPNPENFAAFMIQLKAVKDAKGRNSKALESHKKSMQAVQDATREMFEDWERCAGLLHDANRVKLVWSEYLANCNGDAAVARRFLDKVFDAEQITRAAEWLGLEVPTAEVLA